jgi:methanogenic corrinoid protein MtbC1
MTDKLTGITNAIIELDVDNIKELVKGALDAHVPASDIMKAATKGMDEVGNRYERKEYYLTELVLAGETMKEAFDVLAPALKTEGKATSKGKIVMATVKGDQHDIGKNILKSLLMSKGYEILDLGMDVDAAKVVAKVKESGAKVVALSSLLTMTVEQIKAVHEALKAAGLRASVKLVVGGAPLNMALAKKLGADTYADDATSGVKEIERLFSA